MMAVILELSILCIRKYGRSVQDIRYTLKAVDVRNMVYE
jgi:hypothetical protein